MTTNGGFVLGKALVSVFLALAGAQSFASVFSLATPARFSINSNHPIEFCRVGELSDRTLVLLDEILNYVKSQLTDRAGIEIRYLGDCFALSRPEAPVGITFYDDELTTVAIRREIISYQSNIMQPGHPVAFNAGTWTGAHLVDFNLTSHFQDVSPELLAQADAFTDVGKLNLLKSIGLHEIMHILGFAHEHLHRDSTCHEGSGKYNVHVHTLLTEYDPSSIMNYCLTHHYDYEQGPLPLSELDIEGIKNVYGGDVNP